MWGPEDTLFLVLFLIGTFLLMIQQLFKRFVVWLPIFIVKSTWQLLKMPFEAFLSGPKEPEIPPLSTVHGDARTANPSEITDLLSNPSFANGVHLGYILQNPNQRLAAENPLLRVGYSGEQHLVTIAPTGTGKGATAIIPTLLEYDASAIVVDPKGQAAAVTAEWRKQIGHNVHFINPFGLHGLPDSGFNPLAGLDPNSPHFAAAVAALADALIVHDGGSTHWTDSARSLVKCLVMWTCLTEQNPTLPLTLTPLGWSFSNFQNLMLQINSHAYKPMAHLAGRFTGEDFKDAPGIISTALTQTEIFLEPLAAASLSRHAFAWGDLKRNKTTVFLIPPVDSLGSHGRWLRLLVASALSGLYTPEKSTKPVLFLLDEFAQLGRMTSIENAIGVGRGFGLQFWLILQDLGQLQDLYGKRWESFMANAGIIQVYRPNDPTTAEYFSRKAGNRTVRTQGASMNVSSGTSSRGFLAGPSSDSSGESSGTSYGEAGQPLFSPQDLTGLQDNQQVVFKAGLKFPILAGRVPYYKNPLLASRARPDPFHT